MKKIIVLLSLLSVAFVAETSSAKDTKATPKVGVKLAPKATPASQPSVETKVQPAITVPAVTSQPIVVVSAAPEVPWWKVLIRYSLEFIFTILGILASVFVTVLMKKYGFEDYTAKVNDVLSRGIGFAEQKSLQALKLPDGKPLGSAEKLDIALSFIMEKAKEYKLPDKGKEWWTKKVEGWLGMDNMSCK